MAFIDCVRWAPQKGEVVYAYRYPETNLSTYTQLIVYESQEALLFSKGQLLQKFGPGKHTLNTENIPLLRNLYGFGFGGKNPFTAEVWFVNKVQTFNIGWSISKMSIHDVDYGTMLPLVASGQYGMKVVDSEKFLIKFVGTKYEFTEKDMTEQSYGEFCSKTKSMILQYMLANKIGYKQISAFLDALSQNLRMQLAGFWADLGLELTKFYIDSIEIDTSDENGRRIAEALAQETQQHITGRTWQQEQMFGTANNAIDGFANMAGGNGGGLLGGLMAVQMMSGMGGMGNNGGSGLMQPAYNQPTFNNANGNVAAAAAGQGQGNVREIYCAQCSKKYLSNQAFCPHCGHKYNPCPKCGADNNEHAKRCVSCGTPLQSGGNVVCPNCGAPLAPGAAFCGNCGTRVAGKNENVCSRCGAELAPTAKFCPKCGQPR